MFLGDEVPACGISLGLERILVVMGERGMFPPALASRPADVMVTVWNDGQIDQSLRLATQLRGAGLRVETYPEADKLGKQFKYASSRGIPFVAIIGDEELANWHGRSEEYDLGRASHRRPRVGGAGDSRAPGKLGTACLAEALAKAGEPRNVANCENSE